MDSCAQVIPDLQRQSEVSMIKSLDLLSYIKSSVEWRVESDWNKKG